MPVSLRNIVYVQLPPSGTSVPEITAITSLAVILVIGIPVTLLEVMALETWKLGCRCHTLVRGNTQLLHKVWEALRELGGGEQNSQADEFWTARGHSKKSLL
ncbi:hypothetical protein N657DRAFT_649758 [Parathielavia appendiculata]|uniref:Uncharacterized protein n=1 Tax=Parathielavia appendiculata TaxID=2587402 RepID=A0AAN6TSG4_9PEZI|nr:hypothetical protein N657DRAFT_649758 [Parathielavia appendiculata]